MYPSCPFVPSSHLNSFLGWRWEPIPISCPGYLSRLVTFKFFFGTRMRICYKSYGFETRVTHSDMPPHPQLLQPPFQFLAFPSKTIRINNGTVGNSDSNKDGWHFSPILSHSFSFKSLEFGGTAGCFPPTWAFIKYNIFWCITTAGCRLANVSIFLYLY